MSARTRWLVARTIVARVNTVALESRNLEVYAAEFDYVTDAHDLLLIVWEEIFEHVIN